MRLLLSIAVGLLLVGWTAMAETKVEYKYQNGPCSGSDDGWWSVTTVTDGVPTHITGRGCDGKLYDKDLPRRTIVASDPTVGLAPTFTGNCGDVIWRAVVQRSTDGYVAWMGGYSCDGQYWVIDNFLEPVPGSGGAGGDGGIQ